MNTSSATPLCPALLKVWSAVLAVLLLLLRAGAPLDSHSGREVGREQPRPPVPAHPKAAPRVCPVKVSARPAGAVVAAGRALQAGRQAGRRGGGEQGGRHLAVLLDELPGDDPEDLLDALTRLGADLVAGVPAYLLAPEPGRSLRGRAARLGRRAVAAGEEAAAAAQAPRAGRAEVSAGGSSRWGRRAQAGGEVFGDVSLDKSRISYSSSSLERWELWLWQVPTMQRSNGTSRFAGSRATTSDFVPTTWRTMSWGRLRRSSVSQAPMSAKLWASVME